MNSSNFVEKHEQMKNIGFFIFERCKKKSGGEKRFCNENGPETCTIRTPETIQS